MFDALRFSLFATEICTENPTRHFAAGHDEADTTASLLPRKHQKTSPATDDSDALPFESIGDYITKKGYSHQFLTYYLIPMVAAPWCIDPDEFARSFPAKTLVQFM